MRCSICNRLLAQNNYDDICTICNDVSNPEPTHIGYCIKSKEDYVKLYRVVRAAKFTRTNDDAKIAIKEGYVSVKNRVIYDYNYKVMDNYYIEIDEVECEIEAENEGFTVWRRVRESEYIMKDYA